MRRILRWGILLLAGVVLLTMLISLSQVTISSGRSDVELEFVIVDADSRQPIPNAEITLRIEDEWDRPDRVKVLKLVTDDKGTASVVRESVSRTDVIRPLRATRTRFHFYPYFFTASAPGYAPLAETWLDTTPFESKGYVDEGRFERLQFKITLAKAQAR
jgi:hypothetical protein